ncbi:MAG TPA: HepT-like ribonuclease domain-containing protein [Nakamurella sp.]
MTPDEAEAILALADEVAAGVELAADEAVFRADWRIHYAAERVVERVFQAARDLSEELQERYFGGDAFRALRGMRNRLAHNYLDIDADILWESVSDDLPAVRQRLAADTLEARALIDRLLAEQVVDPGDWDRDHLGAVAPPDPE